MILVRWIRMLFLKHSIRVMKVTLMDGYAGFASWSIQVFSWLLVTALALIALPLGLIYGPLAEFTQQADWLDTLAFIATAIGSGFLLILFVDLSGAFLAVSAVMKKNEAPAARRLENLEANLRRLIGEPVN